MKDIKKRGQRPSGFLEVYLLPIFKKSHDKYISVGQLVQEMEYHKIKTTRDSIKGVFRRYNIKGTPSVVAGRPSFIYRTTDLEAEFTKILNAYEAKGKKANF